MDAPNKEFVLVGSLEELKAEGRLVVQGGHRPIHRVWAVLFVGFGLCLSNQFP